MSKLTELYAKRDREKAKSDYLRLDKAPRSLDYAPGYSGKLGQAVTARNKREFDKTAREKQARRREQVFGAEQATQQQQRSDVAATGLQRQRGQQALQQQRLSGQQRLAEIGTKGRQAMLQQQGKVASKTPVGLSGKDRAAMEARLRKEYYEEGEGGKALREKYGKRSEGGFMGYGAEEIDPGGYEKYVSDMMGRYQPAPLPQPGLAPAPDMLQQLAPENGIPSYTTTGTRAAGLPSFGQQPIPQPAAPFAQQAGATLPRPQRVTGVSPQIGAGSRTRKRWPKGDPRALQAYSPY